MLEPAGDPPYTRFRHGNSARVIFVKKAARGEKDEEQMRKWLENGLPWSLSRWLAKMSHYYLVTML